VLKYSFVRFFCPVRILKLTILLNPLHNNVAVGKVCIILREVDSTNSYAKELLSKSKPSEGTVIFAHYQTGGRGQFGKTWESERGKNLTFSIILYPCFLEAGKAHALNQAVCLGLKDFMESLNITARIKWPNDIYYHDKKLAGLLIENGVIGGSLDYSIIGIGMNVNQTNFSPDLLNPVSVKLIAGKEFKVEDVLGKIFPFIERRYAQLMKGRLREIKKEFEDNLYRIGEKRHYRTANENFVGIISGVNDEGLLLIEADGKLRVFGNNEVAYL